MNNEESTRTSAPPQRIVVREFKSTNITVQVQKTLTFRPYYAIIIGTPNKNDPAHLNRGIFPLHFDGKGHIQEADLDISVFESLIRDALDFAHDCRQQDEDERIQNQIERESRDANHGKPNVRRTGKTQRERDKHKRHNG